MRWRWRWRWKESRARAGTHARTQAWRWCPTSHSCPGPKSPPRHTSTLAPPPRPASLSALAAIHPQKAGRLAPLHAASCCNPAAAAAATGGGGFIGAKDWRLLAWFLMALDKHPVATKAVTSAVLTLAGDLICQEFVVDKVPELDLKRTFVFTFLGLVLVGPTLHVWYLYLSKLVTMSGASGAVARLLLDQVFILSLPNARVYAAAGSDAGSGGVRRKRLAVFVSGRGSNFRSLHDAALGGRVNGDVVVLVTDKPGCGGAEHARGDGIPVIVFPKSKSAPEGLSVAELLNVLRELKVDFILLAGYLKLIPVELVQAYPRSILNIHPLLLPAFGGKGYYGLKVHKAVIASGARYSGPTVHFVDEHYDTGRTIAQRVVPVLANDTPEQLAARVLNVEHKVYVETVAALCKDQIVWREDGIPLIRSQTNSDEYS